MLSKKKWLGIAAAVLVVGGVVAVTVARARFHGDINALGVDLAEPQAYVSTAALSRLPRDLIKAPVARDVLTEDFAFYYEDHEDRLGLRGALKRIAFEHDTTFSDKLIEQALDEPAELAWWTDAKGAPRYWLIAMTRGVLARTLQEVASVAASDKQLSVIDSVKINGAEVTFYALTISARRTFVLAAQGNRVVVLSDPGLLFDAQRHVDAQSRDTIAQLLSGDAKAQSTYRRHFGLGEPGTGHTLIADARMLSFGYQHFFPGLKALRFELGAGGGSLRTLLQVNGANALPTAPADKALWSGLPINPAACALLPVDWAGVKPVMDKARSQLATPDRAAWSTLTDQLEGPAAVCWYARSQLHTPLFISQTKAGAAEPTAALEALSGWMLPASAKALEAPARPGVSRWQHQVTAPWGLTTEGETTVYTATLARQGRWIVFSPDGTLVDLALDAQAKRYPSLADSLPANTGTLALIAPKQVADLAQREAFDVLTPQQELLRQAAQRHLVPRLNALRKLPTSRAVSSGAADAHGWVAVDWQPLAATPASPSAAASAAPAKAAGK